MNKAIDNINFKNPQLLTTALTHRSALNEKKSIKSSYERLEFLGDAILELVVSDYLYKHFPQHPEGKLTNLRSQVVQTKTLAAAAKYLKLGPRLIFSTGEKKSGGAKNNSILADVLEAVIGAIYIDQGLKTTSAFIHRNLLKKISQLKKQVQITDYKSLLQEKSQAKYKTTPIYKVVKTIGPDHNRKFTVKVILNKKTAGIGIAKSKQEAQQQAAKVALEKKLTI